MKALAFISSENEKLNQLQYDKILAALTFDIDVTVVFLKPAHHALINQKIWRSLEIYGVKEVFYLGIEQIQKQHIAKNIKQEKLITLLEESDLTL